LFAATLGAMEAIDGVLHKDTMFTDEQKQIVYPQYAKLVCESDHWLWIAQYLYAAAEKLEPEINRLWRHLHNSLFVTPDQIADPGPFQATHFQRVYLMLIAYSVENLFKGYLVKAQKSQLFDEAFENGELPRSLKTHNLLALASQCPLNLDPDEQLHLERLASHAAWIGRYPYPTKAEYFYVFTDASPVPSNAIGWSSDEVETIKALVEKIAKQLSMPIRPKGSGTRT